MAKKSCSKRFRDNFHLIQTFCAQFVEWVLQGFPWLARCALSMVLLGVSSLSVYPLSGPLVLWGLRGSWSQSQLTWDERQGAAWTGRWCITGNLLVFGLWEKAGASEETNKQGEHAKSTQKDFGQTGIWTLNWSFLTGRWLCFSFLVSGEYRPSHSSTTHPTQS